MCEARHSRVWTKHSQSQLSSRGRHGGSQCFHCCAAAPRPPLPRLVCGAWCAARRCLCSPCLQGPHRLVVRTSRRGRDNPGSTPGEVMLAKHVEQGRAKSGRSKGSPSLGRVAPRWRPVLPMLRGCAPPQLPRLVCGAWCVATVCLCFSKSARTSSSSGQDVASWPRQPRFDSW